MSESAHDYKDSLLLPQTDFPMRAGLPKREPEWLERWERIGVYDRLREQAGGRPVFVLHDGPPYANGHLHIGHALNKILKDIVVRSQQMMGKDARYVPGWDCHGLPIEWKIEEQYRERGAAKDDVPIIELRGECRRFAEQWIDIQRGEFRRLGVTGKWDDPYLTMDHYAEAVIAAEFMKFVMNETLYQGFKPVLWSSVEKTALAEAEVEYQDRKSDAIWVRFPVAVDTELGSGVSVFIWTTTPWTLPSNRAICFNPKIEYGLFEVTAAADGNWLTPGTRLLIADRLAEECMRVSRVDSYARVGSVSAATLDALSCSHPLRGMTGAGSRWDFEVPLLPGEHVTDDAGTGFVHTAPSHGDDDYRIGTRYGLEMPDYVLEDGSFRPDLPFFGGHAIYTSEGKEGTANREVIAKLGESGCLSARARITHSYPHSWRSKAPLIFRCTRQWFAAIDRPVGDGRDELGRTIRERALNSIQDCVHWTPPSGRNRLHSMIGNRPDWVLSRQRAWGVPLTCFTRIGADPKDGDFLLRDDEVNRRIFAAFAEEGADAWYRDDAKTRFLEGLHDPEEFEQVFDILDVWFDSGSTHAFALRDREDGPQDGIADLYLEGTDQHRGWFHSSLLQACGTCGRAPYRGVLTHGFTLDENGMKMAKSLGNTVAPDDVVRLNGADILRLWVAQSDYRTDLRIGKEILKGVTDSYRRLRNCFRFMLGNLNGFSAADAVHESDLPELEAWILHRLAETDRQVRESYAAYDFQRVFQILFDFANGDLSAFYFDIRKDRLYCDAADDIRRRATQTVLDLLHRRLTAWVAPILTFTAEEVWLDRFPGQISSIHLEDFPDSPADWLNTELAAKWSGIRKVRRVVTAALELQRREKIIGSSLEAAPTVFLADQQDLKVLESVEFADICITSGIQLSLDEAPEHAFSSEETQGVAVAFELAQGEKCRRCWKILPDVGRHSHADLCERCDTVLQTRSDIE
ncbi:MAG: isoleucine--tRNA ligase [Rhodobacteraceae bacterium]|nr:isoleucine--tRNA ligase [Paracoccaceae bacterium]